LNVFNPREAYRFVADLSVYVERGVRGRGLGRALLTRLIELGREHGYHKLVLSAFPTNASGMALYARLGFRTVGVYREQGRVGGPWGDQMILEEVFADWRHARVDHRHHGLRGQSLRGLRAGPRRPRRGLLPVAQQDREHRAHP